VCASPALGTTKTAQPNQIPQDAGLTDYEAALVREMVGREPNALEWAMFGAMWSEHCGYKHSKKLLRTLPSRGASVAVGPGENAGAVALGGDLLCVFKVESHNHPSAIEPFQGAATGVGGILRDVFAMGARPTAVLNALFFGDPTDPAVRRTIAGVTGGISFYGNCVGIPDVAGHISFEPGYADNPLVNAMCVGFARAEDLRKASGARPGSAVYPVGGDTGRDGIATPSRPVRNAGLPGSIRGADSALSTLCLEFHAARRQRPDRPLDVGRIHHAGAPDHDNRHPMSYQVFEVRNGLGGDLD